MIRILAITCEEALLSCRWLSTCLPMGSSGFPYFSLPVHEAFAFSSELPLSQHASFPFHPSDSLAHPTGRE